MEKYVIKKDEEYRQLKRKRKIMAGIVFGLIVVMLSGYLPVFIRYGELIPLVNNYTMKVSLEVKSFRDLLLAKVIFDLMLQIPLIILAYTYKKKKLIEKEKNIYRSFHEYLRNEIGLKEISLSPENQSFKGVELAEKQAIALAKRKRESLGPKEELALLLDHARLLINRKRNYRKNFVAGIVTIIAILVSVMILVQLEKYYLNFLYLFLLLTVLVYLAARKKAEYYHKAEKVLALE
jgi:ABC-type multidrug transport system fused ATPase/permease subunit